MLVHPSCRASELRLQGIRALGRKGCAAVHRVRAPAPRLVKTRRAGTIQDMTRFHALLFFAPAALAGACGNGSAGHSASAAGSGGAASSTASGTGGSTPHAGTGGVGSTSSGSTSSSSSGSTADAGSTEAGASSGSGGSAGSSSGVATCPTTERGPAQVVIQGTLPYCLDATEVTMAQYQAWLDTHASPMPDSLCGWNTTYTPDPTANDCADVPFAPATTPDLPVVCVDWCDARDYCVWAGKRLCGELGGGPADFAAGYMDPTRDEWTNACSNGGAVAYPYGPKYVAGKCIDVTFDGNLNPSSLGDPKNVGSAAGCVGGLPGIDDMSGNVWEWENSCQAPSSPPTPANDGCHNRGGSFWETDTTQLSCTAAGPATHTRSYRNKNVGFRCCGDFAVQ